MAGLFPIAARFNHACRPSNNVRFEHDADQGCLRLVTVADTVHQGDELTISYGLDRLPYQLYRAYGFKCSCGACDGLSDDDVERFQVRW